MPLLDTVQAEDLGQQPESRSPDGLRRLTRRDRERIADRIRDLDRLSSLMRETPYAGRWSW